MLGPSYPHPMILSSWVQNVFASHTAYHTLLKGSRQPWFSPPDYISTGSRELLGGCNFRTSPQHPLLFISYHSRSVSSSSNAYISSPPNLLFKTHLHVLAEPHSSQPTHHPSQIPAKSCLTACAAHKASYRSNGPWQQTKAACPSASLR